MKLKYKITDKPSKFLEPDGFTGEINVVEDFAWTNTPKAGRIEVPKLYFTEYSITAGQLISSILYYARILNGMKDVTLDSLGSAVFDPQDPADIYRYKYIAEPTNFKYCVPFFSQQKTSRSTRFSYEDGDNPFSSLIDLGAHAMETAKSVGGFMGTISKGAKIATALNSYGKTFVGLANAANRGKLALEHPKAWTDTDEGTYTVTFDLVNSGTVQDIENNRSFCHLLAYQNSPSRRSFAIVDSVCIYDVWAGDTFHFPAAYIDALDIKNLGNIRGIKFGAVEKNIPEAYRISITFKSLLMMTRQIMAGLDTGERIQAINNVQDLSKTLSKLVGIKPDTADVTGGFIAP